MTAGDAGPAFSLEYSLKTDDLRDLYAADDKLRRRRAWMACLLALCTVGAITLIMLGARGVWSPHSQEAHLYIPAIGALVAVAINAGYLLSRLSSARLARWNWKKTPDLRGRHRDDVGPEGVTVTSPNGIQTSIPWSVIASILETRRSFVLRDRSGQIRVVLPKRGLPDPALLPALGTYLREAAKQPNGEAVTGGQVSKSSGTP